MDETEFETLCRQHWQSVLGYALRRTASTADAADVVSEVFAVAWRRRSELPRGADARPWLFGVARHVLDNQRRGAVRRSRLQDKLTAAVAGNNVSSAGADGLERDDEVAALLSALSKLSELDRGLLTLVGWEELTPAQAARALGISAATARVRLHRARLRLRKSLNGEMERADGSGHVVPGSTSVRLGEAR